MSFTLLAHTAAGSTDHQSVATTGIDTTGADLLLIGFANYQSDLSPDVDSKGNTYLALTRQENASNEGVRWFYKRGGSVGAGHTASFTSGSTNYPAMFFSAWSGSVASPVDQEGGTHGTSGTDTAAQGGAVTPSQDNCLCISICCRAFAPNATSITGVSGATQLDVINKINADHYDGMVAYTIQTTAAAFNPTFSWASADYWAIASVVLKAAGGGGGGSTVFGPLLGGKQFSLVKQG